eukprot:scaffold57646_cov16-Tisochrysis_lutea.AAC.1
MAHPPYRAAYHNALKYLQDLEKPPEQDPQTSTPQDALTADHVKAMLVNAAQDGSAHGLQTRAMMALMFQCIARSDDLRLLRFSHLAQAYVVGCVGPQHMMVWQLMVKGSKTEKDGRAQYMCLTRHKDVDVCAVHALGVYLVQRFTLGNELFPDPHEDWEDYLSRPIFIGPKGGSIRYEHQARKATFSTFQCSNATLIKPYMEAIRHSCSKVCHAFRASGARMVPAIVIARMGRWNIDIQHSNYVTDTPVQGLLAAGGFTLQSDGVLHNYALPPNCTGDHDKVYFHERFTITVPEELIYIVFSFLPRFKESVDKVLRRPKVVGPGNVLQHLTEMGRALVQDAIYKFAVDPTTKCPVVKLLSRSQLFQWQVTLFNTSKASGVLELQRPKPLSEEVAAALLKMLNPTRTFSHAPQHSNATPLPAPFVPVPTPLPLPSVPAPTPLHMPSAPAALAGNKQLPHGFPVGVDFFTSAKDLPT